MKTASAALDPSSGSPAQITTSARRPGARQPISPPSPIASAGPEVIIASASPQLTPVAPGIRCSATRLPAYWRSSKQVARLVVVDHADRDIDPRRPHPADIGLGRRELLEDAGRSFTAVAITGTPARAMRSATRQPSLAPTSTIFSVGNSRLQRQHLEDVARALDMDEQKLPALQHRDQRRGIEAGQQHVLAAARVGP